MSSCPTLTTERLVLRPFRADDVEPLLGIMRTEEVRASLHVPETYDRAAAWGTLLAFAGLWELRGLGQWAVEERAGGRFVGRAGLYWRTEDAWPGVEVGWMLDPSVWGRGYATEAGMRAVRFGFEELGESSLYSVILGGNARSQAVARRLGFAPFEERVLPHFPSEPHMVWRLERSAWAGGAPDPVSAG
jgi:RimJ/RimL family protein N-acetyltransferase